MEDKWLYPEDINCGVDIVINIYINDEGDYGVNIYELPIDWKDKVTQNKGKDGKPSIHDIMYQVYP